MPIIAALLLSELITEARSSKSSLYVAFMDARKAFDVVWHQGLLLEMSRYRLEGDNWLFFKKWYEDITSKVKWKGELSNSITETQGVRQGGTWCPTAYKIFIDSFLWSVERNQVGAYIGSIFCGIPTVADDVTLICTDPYGLQIMLDIQGAYANKNRYQISEQKSTILVYNDNTDNTNRWTLNGHPVTVSDATTHLGVERSSNSLSNKDLITKRISSARRTSYSLMGAGFHGLNGINVHVTSHLIDIYVLPRLLYGLEVMILSDREVQQLELYYRKLLKRIQHLPDRTPNAAVLLLLCRIPVEGELDKNKLKTFGNIIRNENSVERDVAFRQLAMKDNGSGSWFLKVVKTAEKYELPSLYDLLEKPPSKLAWNKIVNKRVEQYHIDRLMEDAEKKSSLKHLNVLDTKKGTVHNIWKSCGTDPRAISMASIKLKIATGTLLLQDQ